MAYKARPKVEGFNSHKITTFRHFKGLMLDLLRGYPLYDYYGKFESIFPEQGAMVVKRLYDDKLIELSDRKEDGMPLYRLTPAGINLALTLINLDYSQKMDIYNKRLRWVTIILGVFTCASVIISLSQLLK